LVTVSRSVTVIPLTQVRVKGKTGLPIGGDH
jgi:hypothetical protein